MTEKTLSNTILDSNAFTRQKLVPQVANGNNNLDVLQRAI